MTAPALSWDAVMAWRLRRQHLAERAPRADVLRVVSDLAGLHAQVMSSAELTLWARVEDADPAAVRRALWEDRTLVKTWAMRGTLHLLPAAELSRYTGAMARLRPRHHVPAWLRAHGLTRTQAEAMLEAIPYALAGGPLTREQLAAAVAERVGEETLAGKLAGGFGDLLKPAAFAGDLCFAPGEGRLVRFTRPRDWLAGFPGPEPAEPASRAVLRAYLAAYGPAPREQFQRWFGMTSPAEAGRWIAELGDAVCEVDVEGERGWMLAADVRDAAAAAPEGVVRLLPAFDHHTVAAPRSSDAVLPAAHRARVYRPQGWLSPVLLVDGRMAGTWSHTTGGGVVAVTIAPFARLDGGVRAAAEAEAERLAGYLGGELRLGWEPATGSFRSRR